MPCPEAETICRVWGELLGVGDVSVHDDFFGLGGQSLTAVRAVTRLREALGVPVDVQAIFAHPTAAGLAAALGTLRTEREELIRPATRAELSFGQERIWIFEQLNSDVPAYHLPLVLAFPNARADVPVLETALSALVRRHEVLRTALPTVDGQVQPETRAATPVPVTCVETSEEALDELLTERIRIPFALEEAPLLRAELLRTPQRDLLLLTLHHIASDGTSLDLVVRELGDLYEELRAGGSPRQTSLPVQYADFAQWQRERLDEAELERLLGYWRQRLDGVPALELPTDRPRPAIAGHRGSRELFRVPAP